MKKTILLFSLIILSCSAERVEDDCRCVKTTYEYNQVVSNGANGLPVIDFIKVVLFEENIDCNDEVKEVENGDGTLFDINCY